MDYFSSTPCHLSNVGSGTPPGNLPFGDHTTGWGYLSRVHPVVAFIQDCLPFVVIMHSLIEGETL
jgi:hypothetical protein